MNTNLFFYRDFWFWATTIFLLYGQKVTLSVALDPLSNIYSDSSSAQQMTHFCVLWSTNTQCMLVVVNGNFTSVMQLHFISFTHAKWNEDRADKESFKQLCFQGFIQRDHCTAVLLHEEENQFSIDNLLLFLKLISKCHSWIVLRSVSYVFICNLGGK